MILYIIDKNNTPYIGLNNHKNSFCHYIVVLQRLHSSQTLTKEIDNYFSNNNYSQIISQLKQIIDNPENCLEFINNSLKPLYEYSKLKPINTTQTVVTTDKTIDTSNPEYQVYNNIKQQLENFFQKYVSSNGYNGYISKYNLIYFFIPIIYLLFKNSFQQIINELQVHSSNFVINSSTVFDILMTDSFFNSPYNKYTYELFNYFINNSNEWKSLQNISNFIITYIDVYPNAESTGGHALNLIKGKDNNYYIIDDQNYISPLEEYYKQRVTNLYQLAIYDISTNDLSKINQILQSKTENNDVAFLARTSRYVLNFSHKFNIQNYISNSLSGGLILEEIDKSILTPEPALLKNQINTSLSGGLNSNQIIQSNNQYIYFILFIISIVIIISLIIIIICKNKHISINNYPIKT